MLFQLVCDKSYLPITWVAREICACGSFTSSALTLTVVDSTDVHVIHMLRHLDESGLPCDKLEAEVDPKRQGRPLLFIFEDVSIEIGCSVSCSRSNPYYSFSGMASCGCCTLIFLFLITSTLSTRR